LSPLPKVSNSLTSPQRFRRADSSSATASSEKVPYRAENNFLEDAKHAPHAETQLLLQLQLGRTTTPKPFGGKNQKKKGGETEKHVVSGLSLHFHKAQLLQPPSSSGVFFSSVKSPTSLALSCNRTNLV